MRISLLSADVFHPLAGEAGVAESVHSSAGEFRMEPTTSKQVVRRVRAPAGQVFDRGNLLTEISFSTVRTFASCMAAEKFAMDYDRVMPRVGTLVLATTGGGGVPDYILVSGAITTDGSTPAEFPQLDYAGPVNSRPSYEDPLAGGCSVQWTGSAWLLSHTGDVPLFTSADDVASPDLVTTWTEIGTADGTPRLFGSYPDSRYLHGAVLDAPGRTVLGCSVMLRYTATGGEPTNLLSLS